MTLKIDRSLVLRNTLINILGGLAPMAVSLLTLPRILGRLGADRYGMLNLALVAFGYFGMLDVGTGTATTKFVAEKLGKGEEDALPSIVWTAVLWQGAAGLVGGLILAALAGQVAVYALKVPAAMQSEVRFALIILGFAVPLMLIAPTLAGVLEAGQRFDLANAVSVPSSIAISLAIYAAASVGWQLPGVVALMAVVRLINTGVLAFLCTRLFPSLRRVTGVTWQAAKRLLGYGAWFTAGGLVVPVLIYADRFMLGRYTSLADVAYYVVPLSLVQKLWVLPQNLVRTLFPAFSALGAGDRNELEHLYIRWIKYVVLASAPGVLFLAFFAHDLFLAWLGPEAAEHSAPIVRILLFGGLAAVIGYISGALLEGVGRPDITASWNLGYTPIHAALVYFLVVHWGAQGAAWSFSLRVIGQTAVFLYMSFRVAGISYASLREHRLGWTGILTGGLCAAVQASSLAQTLTQKSCGFAAGSGLILVLGWLLMLDGTDHEFIRSQFTAKLRRGSSAAA